MPDTTPSVRYPHIYSPHVFALFSYNILLLENLQRCQGAQCKCFMAEFQCGGCKVSKTLFATVVGFVSLWMPANCIYLYSVLSPVPRELALFATMLVFSTSCVNPFIYGFMNRAFKKEFKKYLGMKKKRSIDAESSPKREVFFVNSKTIQSWKMNLTCFSSSIP